jgi:hypothetical protein
MSTTVRELIEQLQKIENQDATIIAPFITAEDVYWEEDRFRKVADLVSDTHLLHILVEEVAFIDDCNKSI